jgi:Saxitoxin biosynthesis operon protein SxtJ
MQAKTASSRSFGLLITFALTLVGGLSYWHGGDGSAAWFVAAALFLAVSLAMPRLLLPLKRLWLRLGSVLHTVMSPIILGLLYLFSIVTVGLLVRVFGKDLLSLRRDAAAASYWIRREPPGPSRESLRNQF